jgi:hypothetical protein
MSSQTAILALTLLAARNPASSAAAPSARTYDLDGPSGLLLKNVAAEAKEHEGRKAVRIVEAPGAEGETIALLPDSDFGDGTLEVELAGRPAAGAPETSRGFVGIAFRVDPASLAYECFYLRPTNGRAEDQLRRNHSTQYVSHPDFPWPRLRKEQPGVYESYVDLEPGAWTRVQIVVSGTSARLFVHGAEQPALIVNDLKRGRTRGAVALWIGPGTEAFFRTLRLTPKAP